ncbi:PaaI family thioesterase [Granulicella sp. L60]|uniref:PaaI family thioesterase n=1 Tax=Granulicella sp. L60 TaxID=1641866 RepID=UPI00131C0D90|nr:PaaI family thioesterase [Granulicella sp. L60]
MPELQEKLSASSFNSFLGLVVEEASPEQQRITVRVKLRPELERGRDTGQWHGGVIAALIDIVGDYALVMLLGRPLPTINFRVDYLRPAINTSLKVVAQVIRAGKSIGVVDVNVLNEAGELVAVGRANYSTLS